MSATHERRADRHAREDTMSDRHLLADFGSPEEEYRTASSAAALFDDSASGRLEATGRDALVFLHNVTSNDVKGLGIDSGCEAFFLTAKARVVAHGRLFRYPPDERRERIDIDLPAGQAPAAA